MMHQKKIEKEKYNVAVIAVFLALVPVICAWLYCRLSGQHFSQIYLPDSTWNDELFYYKMTENVLEYGYPQGYFGFNESHGQYLSFAAWSPVLLIFWVIWGFLFGWNLLSPMLCNIALLSLAMLFFGILAKPNKRQALMIGLLYGTFIPITRFALSCIPEAELFALFIVFWGLAAACQKRYKGWMIGIMFVLVMLMTWMRPYLILLLLTPAALLFRKKGKKAFLLAGGVGAVTMAAYVMINHFFSAPYIEDLFYTEWITIYFEKGIFEGLHYTLWKLYASLMTVLQFIRANLIMESGLGYASGLYYFVFLLLLFVLLTKVIWRFLYKNWKGFLMEGQMLLCMIGFFAADLLMYRIREGGRHTLVYIAGFLCLLPLAEMKKQKQIYLSAGISVFFALLFLLRGDIPNEFAVPYGTEERRAELESLAGQLSENMELTEGGPNYENTVIWTLAENIDGEVITGDFGAYYALPKGFGINLGDGAYMEEHLENLQSRYIGVEPGGGFEKRCVAAGGAEVGRCRSLVLYDMRPVSEKEGGAP